MKVRIFVNRLIWQHFNFKFASILHLFIRLHLLNNCALQLFWFPYFCQVNVLIF